MLTTELTGQATTHLYELKKNILVHKDVLNHFLGLQGAAQKAGFNLQIASGFRSFDRQLDIWNNKYSGNRPILDQHETPLDLSTLSELEKLYAILHWSALPGTSRHHWGTDFDIYDPNLLPPRQDLALTVSEYENAGYFSELTHWLTENMALFGFYRPYQSFLGGVAVEPWHISYAPIANEALQQLKQEDILSLIDKRVLGKALIHQELPNIYNKFVVNINQIS